MMRWVGRRCLMRIVDMIGVETLVELYDLNYFQRLGGRGMSTGHRAGELLFNMLCH